MLLFHRNQLKKCHAFWKRLQNIWQSSLNSSTSYIRNRHQGFINFFRYKPVIIFEIGAYWTTWALLVWANGVAWMKFMQFTFGLASATEVAYYTYMYAQVRYAAFKIINSYRNADPMTYRILN